MFIRRSRCAVSVILLVGLFFPVLPLNAQRPISFERDRMKDILNVVSKRVEVNFYDSKLKGVNWKQLTQEARDRIDKADNVSDMVTAIFVLVDKVKDSHTKFLPPGRVNLPKFGFDAKAFGDEIRVYEVKKDSSASAAGIKPGDVILTVDGYAATREQFDLMMLYFRVLQPVSAIELQLKRGKEPPKKLVLQAVIKPKSVVTDLTDSFNIWELIREAEADEKEHHYNNKDDIGLIQVASFESEDLSGLVGKVKNSRAVVVDLRGNPGGRIDTLRSFTGCFENAPVILADQIGRTKTVPIKIKPQNPQIRMPLVVLVDSETSSAAEMFARHVQRTKRGYIMGDRTSGRVTASLFYPEAVGVESIVPYGVQVGVGRIVFPDGIELEGKGVTPDEMCLPTAADMADGRDVCLAKAREYLRKQLGPAAPTQAN
jgi:carboxyl-terminal processing protease